MRADENTPLTEQTGNFTALSCYDEFAYAVNGNSIWQYNVEKNQFTDFEICANSARPNRLSGATDILLIGNQLLVSDNGNQRISVFNTVTNAFIKHFNTDMLFIDEGFGNLSDNYIEKVLQSFDALIQLNFTVGFSTHVEKMQYYLNSRILVTKDNTDEGSKIEEFY